MKKTSIMFGLLMMMGSAYAAEYKRPTAAEISQYRACFEDLEVQGCGKLEEDHVQFRSCMSNVQDSLDDHCKKMMKRLYGSRD